MENSDFGFISSNSDGFCRKFAEMDADFGFD